MIKFCILLAIALLTFLFCLVLIKIFAFIGVIRRRLLFWKVFECYHLIRDPDWQVKVGALVTKKISALNAAAELLKKELLILEGKIRVIKSKPDTDEGSLINLYQESTDMRIRLCLIEEKLQVATDLALAMNFDKEVRSISA